MSRIRGGWELTKKSWGLLRSHSALLRFPVYGALAAIVVVVVAVLPGLYLIDSHTSTPGGVALVAVGLYLASFVGFYFAVGLCATADLIFHGRQATVADGSAVARQRLGAIAGWALVSTLLGLVFAALENLRGVGSIIGGLLNAAWSLITFMAVPVIAIEGTGPVATLKRSSSLFREKWAGQVTGNIAIGGIVFLVGILPGTALTAAGVLLWSSDGGGDDIALGGVLVGLGVLVLVVSGLIVRALRGVFGVALYRFAAEGEATGGFTAEELSSAVRTR